MKKFFLGVIVGLFLGAAPLAFAAQQVHLIVDGNEIAFPEAPPQIINGRTMVPARPLAEALGATVEWDPVTWSVIVTKATNSQNTNNLQAPEGYYPERQILNVLMDKYPDKKLESIAPGEFYFDDIKYVLPSIIVGEKPSETRQYFSPTPLIEAGLITQDDLQK